MKQYGLIGKTLSHSWSQRWFEDMFGRQGITYARYSLYEMTDLSHLREWVVDNGINGFNVTIPYKQAVIQYLDSLDDVARTIGAVNCVEVSGNYLIGHNTDSPAFLETLQPLLQPHHTAALLLGTGGAAKAVGYALRQLGIDYQLVSRTPSQHPHAISYSDSAHLAASHYLIINATPLGMFPHTENTPWPYSHLLTEQHLCYDLVYNPFPTLFLRQASATGAHICGGLDMLERQAQLSWNIWNAPK